VDGRRLGFTVTGYDGETVAARGTVQRILVDRERFVSKAVNR
jgi:predicted thioesterase